MRYKNLSNWVIVYNQHTDQFRATKRENYNELFNDNNSPLVLRSNTFNTLAELIELTNGDKDKINQLIKNGI